MICCAFAFITMLPGMLGSPTADSTQPVPSQNEPTVTPAITPSVTLPPVDIPQEGNVLLEDDFMSTSNSARAVFGGDFMTFGLVDGRGYLSGGSPGVLPAVYYDSEFGDLVIEFDIQIPSPRAGSQYGAILRGETAENGTLDWYYLVGFKPVEKTLIFACWLYDHWSVEKSFTLPEGVLQIGSASNHVVLEARGPRFRAFLNNVLVLDLTDSTIENPGVFGFFIAPGEGSTTGSQDYVYFDNLRISAPAEP